MTTTVPARIPYLYIMNSLHLRVYCERWGTKGKSCISTGRCRAQGDSWPAPNHTGDKLEETWPCPSATGCRLEPALCPRSCPSSCPLQAVVTGSWSWSISWGEAHSLLCQGLCQVAPLRIAFMITVLMQAGSRLLGGCLYCTDLLSGLTISSLPASKNCLP